MNVLTVAGLLVATAIVVAILVAAHRSRNGSGHSSSVEPPPGAAFGAVPGYMPGMGPRVEQQHDVATPTRVEPPHRADGATTVDLDGNVAHLRTGE